MASSNTDLDTSSMFMQKTDNRNKSPVLSQASRRNSTEKSGDTAEIITVKDFFDFMKTAYQVYEHLEGEDEDGSRIDWEELTKLTVINHVIEQQERDLLYQTALIEQKPITSKSDTNLENSKNTEVARLEKRSSCSEIEGKLRKKSFTPEARVEMLGVWTEANLNCKLNDVINEGILDSILPYLVGYKKTSKATSVYTPIIKKSSSNNCNNEVKKPASFGGFVNEKESRDRLGRRRSSVAAARERLNQKQDGDVEIHVCDEVKGLKKDFRCPQKLLVSKMGYFADVTAGQRLEDMDISVHCDIQIFDWLMRWVKRDTILVADWPLLEPGNVVPILVSASFLQMEPLLHDCLMYCHAHLSDVVKTATNLACLSDALLTRLAAMYTNSELEQVRDRRDKVVSRLYCRLIQSLAEPVPETLRGHYASLATLFKCSKCNKLLGRHIAEQVPCQPSAMRLDRRGHLISTHTRDTSWSLSEYVSWLYGELRSWRRVYWRLWADCHFLRCQLCDTYFPVYQMEWCSVHAQGPHMFSLEGRPPLPAGRHPCCGERAYRYETLPRSTGCQFRTHAADDRAAGAAPVLQLVAQHRDLVVMRPPQLVFPERLTRLVTREPGEEPVGRLQCKEVFWWEGIQLVPPRQPLGLLGKLYTNNNKFNPAARAGSAGLPGLAGGAAAAAAAGPSPQSPAAVAAPEPERARDGLTHTPDSKTGISAARADAGDGGGEASSGSSDTSDSSDSSDASEPSEEEAPPRRPPRRVASRAAPPARRRCRVSGRQWAATLSARTNQDQQRRFEERAARQMRAALARRAAALQPRTDHPPGGVYARLEAEWRERHAAPAPRAAPAARARPHRR